jgi:iron complex transport system ATP-binding protein
MDPGVRERFLGWLNQLAASARSCAMILVTLHVEEIMPAFESTLVVRDGQIAAAGPTREVVTGELLEHLYGVEVDRVEEVASRLWPIWRSP